MKNTKPKKPRNPFAQSAKARKAGAHGKVKKGRNRTKQVVPIRTIFTEDDFD